MNRAYKYRLYPTKTQEQKLSKAFGCTRFVWNNCVALFNDKQETKAIPQLKTEFIFLNDVSCAILQQKQRDFISFKKQFFSKTRKSKIKSPQFKKRGQNDSFRLPNPKFKIVGHKIQLEKIGKISFVQDRPIHSNAKFLSVTVSKNASGQYFASVLVEIIIEAKDKTDKIVGIDLGLKSFVMTSDGKEFESNKFFRENQSKLRTAQKHLSRKNKGSIRFNRCKKKVAIIHQKVSNQRNHYLHQITNELINNYDTIVIEDLNVKGMVRNRKLAKSISDASFATFRQQLTYKCKWYGKILIIANRFYPSSKICSNCQSVKSELKLSQRTYKCDKCGFSIDRDLNAAINLKNIAVRVLAA